MHEIMVKMGRNACQSIHARLDARGMSYRRLYDKSLQIMSHFKEEQDRRGPLGASAEIQGISHDGKHSFLSTSAAGEISDIKPLLPKCLSKRIVNQQISLVIELASQAMAKLMTMEEDSTERREL
jgi:hypothetical protein